MDLRWGTRTSLSTVINPHIKNKVVTTVRATRWVDAVSAATGPGELTVGIAINIVASVIARKGGGPGRRVDAPEDNRLTSARQAFTSGLTSLLALAQTGVPFGTDSMYRRRGRFS